jgi:hypothetical protein
MLILQRKFVLFVLVILINACKADAQSISIDQTLAFINSKFGNTCKVDVKNGYLLADFFDGNGQLIRKDKGDISHLDATKSSYSKDEKMLYLMCDDEDCVERKLMGNTRVTRLYDRYPFVWEGDEKSADALIKAFNHLIRTLNEKGYKNNTPFE